MISSARHAMRLVWFVAVIVVLAAPPAHAELWKYEDGSGAVNFTDSLANVPPEYRHTARRHTVQDPGAAPSDGGVEAIQRERERVIASFTPEQLKEALAKGLLTVDEVNQLVAQGALRSSDVGDQYRFAGKPAPKAAAPSAPPIDLAERELQSLMALRKSSTGQAAQARSMMDNLSEIKDSPKFTYALVGELGLAVLLIVTMPFVMRKYNDDGTRRIIRASFFFIFIIVSMTGNMLLFKDEVAGLLEMKHAATPPGASDASAAQPASLQGKPWQPDPAENAAPVTP